MEALTIAEQEEQFPADFAPRGERLVRDLLHELGEDPTREGLVRTPSRVWAALSDLTDGYRRDPLEVIGDAIFEAQADDLVAVHGIEFYSLCEHHLLPFFGQVHIAYVPDGRIAGLSKLPRIVDLFSRRLQVQEKLTAQIADALIETLQPKGVAVVMEGHHLCMMMRGVEKQRTETVTSAMRGVFKTDSSLRGEFLGQIRGH